MADLVVSSLGVVANTSGLYCTVSRLAAELGIGDTDDDGKLGLSVSAASREIDGFCGWRFWQDATAQAREFYPWDNGTVYLLDDDPGDGISTTTGLVVKIDNDGTGTYETTLTVDTDFLLLPRNAATRNPVWPYTEVRAGLAASNYAWPNGGARAGVQITAKWGWPAVPDDVTKACLVQAAELYKAKDTAFGVAGSTEFGVLRVRPSLHPTAQALLRPYRKPAVG